jgi:hypothetical protein
VPIECAGDPEALAELIDNLLDAANAHAVGAAATVSLRRVGTRAVIRVRATRDPHALSARAIGLKRARAIAAAHHGRLSTIIGPPGTLTLRCELPASPAE